MVFSRRSISKDSDISKQVQDCLAEGWKFEPGSKHGKLTSPEGRVVSVPCTPGGPSAARKLRSDIRRASET